MRQDTALEGPGARWTKKSWSVGSKVVGTEEHQSKGLLGAGVCRNAGPSALQLWHCSR